MSIEFQTLQFTMQSSSSHPVFVKSFHVNMRFYTSKVTLRARSDQFLLTPHLLGEISWGAHDSSLSLMLYLNVRVGISMNFLHCWQVHGQQTVSKAKDMLQINAKAHEGAERTIETSQT
jgi:hypothetical protein